MSFHFFDLVYWSRAIFGFNIDPQIDIMFIMGIIALTSTGMSAPLVAQKIHEIISQGNLKSVAIITTASDGKEENKYSRLALNQFKQLKLKKIDFVDIEFKPVDFSTYDIIYVCGGNTFKLLKFAKSNNFKDAIVSLLDRGGMYIGVSAGSCILAPTITAAATIEPDPNDIGLTDWTGLGIIDFEVHPHYSPEEADAIHAYEQETDRKVKTLTDDQAILLENNKLNLIG